MGKFLKISVGLVIIITIVLAVVISQIDVNQYREDVIQLVREKSGREFDVGGEFKLGLSLIPTVILEDVTLGNAKWGSRPEMIKVGRFEVEIALIPLFSRNIQVNRLILNSPEIFLETNKQGEGNWQIKTDTSTSAKEPSSDSLPVFNINELVIEDAHLTYLDGVTGQTSIVRIDKFNAEADGFTRPMTLLVRAAFNEIPVNVDGTLGSLGSLTGNKEFPVKIMASVSDSELSLDGKIDQPMQAKGLDVNMKFKAKSLSSFEKIAARKLPDIGPLQVAGHVREKDGIYFIKGMRADLGKAKIDMDGKIGQPPQAEGSDLVINLEADSLEFLGAVSGTEVPPGIGPVSLNARLTDKDGAYQLDDMKLKAGNTDITGSASINLKGKRPALNANLNAGMIDLVPFAGEEKAEKEKKVKVFSADPLPLEGLKSTDVNLNLKANQIKTKDMTMENVDITLTLNNGKLSVKPFNAGVGGGNLAMQLNLDASSGKSANLDTSFNLKNFQPSTLPDLKDELTGGKTDVAINAKGSGSSVAAIMAGLNGNLLITMGEGSLKSSTADKLGGDLLTSTFNLLNPAAKSAEGTQIECGVIKFDIADGMATTDNGIGISTKKMHVTGSGVINLKTEELNIGIKPKAREGIGISAGSLAELVKVGGTLANPKPVPDTMAAFKTTLSVGTAVATGGLSLLAEGLLSKSDSDADPCATALGLKPKKTASEQKKEPVEKSVTEQATDTVKDVGGTIKDTFKGLFD